MIYPTLCGLCGTVFVGGHVCREPHPVPTPAPFVPVPTVVAPAPLRWTREAPTREGWYWHRNAHAEVAVLLVTYERGELCCEAGPLRTWVESGNEWAGPIPAPEEP